MYVCCSCPHPDEYLGTGEEPSASCPLSAVGDLELEPVIDWTRHKLMDLLRETDGWMNERKDGRTGG